MIFLRGAILAGGMGTRLRPLTLITNKHLLPVGQKPMILYPLHSLQSLGITDIAVVSGREHCGDFSEFLASGRDYGVDFTYKVQEEAGGIAQALGVLSHYDDQDGMLVVLGDNIFDATEFSPSTAQRIKDRFSKGIATIFLKSVPDPQRFGVATISGDHITSIIEKPKEPASNLAVTGIYAYPSNVFSVIKTLKPSARGELEITDVNNHYLKEGKLAFEMVKGNWTDAGTFDSLHRANKIVRGESLE